MARAQCAWTPSLTALLKAGRARAHDAPVGISAGGQDIRDRAFDFGCHTARLARDIGRDPGLRSISDQLLKSATGIGANLEEAKAASSRREFVRYVDIALREAREAVYWLRVCAKMGLSASPRVQELRDEGQQIARILGAIAVNARRPAR